MNDEMATNLGGEHLATGHLPSRPPRPARTGPGPRRQHLHDLLGAQRAEPGREAFDSVRITEAPPADRSR